MSKVSKNESLINFGIHAHAKFYLRYRPKLIKIQYNFAKLWEKLSESFLDTQCRWYSLNNVFSHHCWQSSVYAQQTSL